MKTDRIFATLIMLVTLGYGFIAFTGIKAPFQYDPLGPESWPRLLSIVALLCCLFIIFKPDNVRFELLKSTGIKMFLVLLSLVAYAILFEPAGFILSTFIFCAASSRLLGASYSKAIIFGLATGLIGYVIGSKLLSLNLPSGILSLFN